jgi:hypothetical protein
MTYLSAIWYIIRLDCVKVGSSTYTTPQLVERPDHTVKNGIRRVQLAKPGNTRSWYVSISEEESKLSLTE